MIITPSKHIAPVSVRKVPTMADIVADPSRPVSIGADLAGQLGIPTGPPVVVTPHFVLRGLDLGGLPPDQTKALNKAVKNASNAIFDNLKAANPLLRGGLDGYELVVAVVDAHESWTDPKGITFTKAGGATVKAMKEAMDVLNCVVPGVAANRYAYTATMFLSIAGKAFQYWADISPPAEPERFVQPPSFGAPERARKASA